MIQGSEENQVCARCVMDASVPGLVFDEQGVCNYCKEFLERSGHLLEGDSSIQQAERERLVARVKERGRGRAYDCVVGMSGGVDSSWSLVKAVELGLRPLAVHMDNGWNSELAQNNIANLVRTLHVDLHTDVIEWNEYRRLMQAFFDADVIDVELLYDNAMIAVNYQQAAKHGVRYILAGTNEATEGMRMPREWNWLKHDKRNIRAVARRFGRVKLESFPSIGTAGFIWYEFVRRIRWRSFLDYLDYDKEQALETLQRDYGYKPYPYKHYESIFTRFYQGYILLRKFGVDKRRVHLSTLVAAKQMSRADALEQLRTPAYGSEQQLESDIRYFIKKMQWSMSDLEAYLDRPATPHSAYPSERPVWEALGFLHRRLFGQRDRGPRRVA
ncbi:MAG: N-acetyl sugar amidotransferase [Longimicrobiales bacterium]